MRRIKPGTGARLWRPCTGTEYNPPPDEKKHGKMCRRCGRGKAAHFAEGLPLPVERLCELACEKFGVRFLEWRELDNVTRAQLLARYRLNALCEAFDREVSASAEFLFRDRS